MEISSSLSSFKNKLLYSPSYLFDQCIHLFHSLQTDSELKVRLRACVEAEISIVIIVLAPGLPFNSILSRCLPVFSALLFSTLRSPPDIHFIGVFWKYSSIRVWSGFWALGTSERFSLAGTKTTILSVDLYPVSEFRFEVDLLRIGSAGRNYRGDVEWVWKHIRGCLA